MIFKKVFIILFFLSIPSIISAQQMAESPNKNNTNRVDDNESNLELRIPSYDSFEKYLDDKEFDYSREAKDPETLWDKIQNWINAQIMKLFGTGAVESFWDYFGYALILFALIVIVYGIYKSEIRSAFYKEENSFVSSPVETKEDINKINFTDEINSAVKNNNYKKAIRLYYLQTLKKLSGRNIINWKQDKTNYEYISEIKNSELKELFLRLTYYFEYIWYGDFKIDDPLFSKVESSFKKVDKYLNNK